MQLADSFIRFLLYFTCETLGLRPYALQIISFKDLVRKVFTVSGSCIVKYRAYNVQKRFYLFRDTNINNSKSYFLKKISLDKLYRVSIYFLITSLFCQIFLAAFARILYVHLNQSEFCEDAIPHTQQSLGNLC